MGTCSGIRRDPAPNLFGLMILLIVSLSFAALIVTTAITAPAQAETLSSIMGQKVKVRNASDILNIPLTEHALRGHPDRFWDAIKIQEWMATGKCHPVLAWACKETIILTCPYNEDRPDLLLGLVVGTSNPNQWQVVTGYPDTWGQKTTGCMGPILLP